MLNINRAVFLDRDGVLNKVIPRGEILCGSPRSLKELELLPRVSEALALLKGLGLRLIVVTNQPEIARREIRLRDLWEIHQELARRLPLDDIFLCPHKDGDSCGCRKPLPGMLFQAADKHNLELRSCFLVGDRWRDTEAGRRTGCITFLIRTPWNGEAKGDYVVDDLYSAAVQIARLERSHLPQALPERRYLGV